MGRGVERVLIVSFKKILRGWRARCVVCSLKQMGLVLLCCVVRDSTKNKENKNQQMGRSIPLKEGALLARGCSNAVCLQRLDAGHKIVH